MAMIKHTATANTVQSVQLYKAIEKVQKGAHMVIQAMSRTG